MVINWAFENLIQILLTLPIINFEKILINFFWVWASLAAKLL